MDGCADPSLIIDDFEAAGSKNGCRAAGLDGHNLAQQKESQNPKIDQGEGDR
jgi:hypothetical protein